MFRRNKKMKFDIEDKTSTYMEQEKQLKSIYQVLFMSHKYEAVSNEEEEIGIVQNNDGSYSVYLRFSAVDLHSMSKTEKNTIKNDYFHVLKDIPKVHILTNSKRYTFQEQVKLLEYWENLTENENRKTELRREKEKLKQAENKNRQSRVYAYVNEKSIEELIKSLRESQSRFNSNGIRTSILTEEQCVTHASELNNFQVIT